MWKTDKEKLGFRQDIGTESEAERETKKETERRKAELGIRILQNCQNELYSYFPYLDGVFAALKYRPGRETGSIGTDGEFLCFSPDFLIHKFREEPQAVRRGYLHILLHCLYLHPFYGGVFPGEGPREARLWNLACDMWVESVIEQEGIPGLSVKRNPLREQCFWIMRKSSLSAEKIYYMLAGGHFPAPVEALCQAFSFDDHKLWEKEKPEKRAGTARRKWEELRFLTGAKKQQRKKRAGTSKGNVQEEMEARPGGKFDYRKFLKRFAVPREEVELDTESFDYIFYNLGMERYGNTPLIEPLEYKEVNRLEELVIAIDTSSSCSAETVRGFLGETYRILEEKENFFRKMKVYLIQCDSFVQDVKVIHSEEEWKAYSKNIKIMGRGGTDFRPVFQYISQLQEKKELRNLKALIYFTDGDGIYPKSRPDYETAFVFLDRTGKMDMVPDWAYKLLVPAKTGKQEEDL